MVLLLENDVGASFFESLLGLIRGILANAGEDLAASGFRQGLGFAETKAGQLTNNLDDVDLLGASVLDDHIELSLFFDGFGSSSTSAGHGSHCDRSGGRNAPLLFQ